MIDQINELSHHSDSSSEWEERYRFNFADKKTKVFGSAEIILKPHSKECTCDMFLFIDGTEFTASEKYSYEPKESQKTIGSKLVKYKVVDKNLFELTVKNSQIEGSFTISALQHEFDFPWAPGRSTDLVREGYENSLWKRYEQRCRFSGHVSVKNGKSRKIEAYGEREHVWGQMLWKNLVVHSRYHMQFKDMSIAFSYQMFDSTAVANGFISRRSGNIPVISMDLEHLEAGKTGSLVSSEISYIDSQDDRDLIVATTIKSIPHDEVRAGKKKFLRFKSFSEFSIIGANKKGVGYEEHLVVPEKLPFYTSDK